VRGSRIAVMTLMTILLGWAWGTAGTTAQDRACAADMQKFCQKVPTNQKGACLKEHAAELSAPCKEHIQAAQQGVQDIREACQHEVAQLCPGVSPGRPLMQCLRQHTAEVSPDCKAALSHARPAPKSRP
jgi:hypothetical protein